MLPTRLRKIQYMTTKIDPSELEKSGSLSDLSKLDTNGREYFPEFVDEEYREEKLQEVLQNHFFQPHTDKRKRRNAVCELCPQERTVILYAMSASLSVRLEELALL